MADEGAVTVCVRVRPLIARENASGDKVSLHWRSENNTVSDVNGTKIFSYDRVFHSSDSTQQLYDGVAVPIIQSAVQGYNGTIFAYGQTASGKTYTMMGNEDSMGIIPKAIQHVFKIICEIPDREFLLRVSYMEIYNETITDLLCDNRKKKPLGIREDVNRNTYVEDLIEEVVVSPEQAMQWIRKGERNRHYGETKMNEHSSRSHTIFRMIIESRERSDPANANCDGAVMVSHLNLVDLAGSERASQTGSEGVRLKEGCNINRSLFILSQVIKKLCDDPSGFINYRDSKLTRILQNSLGGNAKTVIICTITPVSFDETLSTLQFANTAKGMKNTPKVNEVLDDDALLKRYRKEILDLKKQLEEVSSKTQIHAMEKDQLAQLLEEKNSLQKVQEDRIRNLTEMLVTSASFSSKQNVKGKRRRRVTWAPGKINQAGVSFFEDFENAMLAETKKMKLSLPAVPDVEDSTLENSEYESTCLLPPDQISEAEWIAGPNMNWTQKDFEESVQLCEALALEKDIAVNEVNVLQANFDNLVLENEQLKSEINEMKEKLKEKTEIDEFEALEKQAQKDHEIQLMHEIASLKNQVSNAEVYNEELEAELNSKLEQLKEKENKIKILQNCVEELQKAGVGKKETSFSMGDSDKLIEEIQQLKKSLLDSEAITLDAKKESAFLRSENLELKEKMNGILNSHNQLQKDVQLYQSQIEAGKASYRKMQADLQRELQSLFQENARLTSLMEGKVPKDFLSRVELEKKAADLKGELENALKENALLQKQVNELSEFQSLPNTVEMQKKEILEKCEELRLLKLENEKLLSEVADNEMRLKCMSEEIEKSKDNLTDAQLKYLKSHEEYVALKQLHEEIERKYIAASETNEQMKLQIECLSKEAQESKTILDEVKVELSSKMKELEEKTVEQKQLLELREDLIQTQQKLNEMEELKEKERISEVRREAEDLKIQAVLQQLTECQEEIKTLIRERDDLKQKGESLQAETEQLREDMKDTISMNILAQEDLRNTQNSLKESQNTIKKLEKSISEKESQILSVEEAQGKTIKELQIRISEMTEEMKIITSERDQLAEEKSESNSCRESDQLQVQKEQILFLTQENRSLQEKLDSLLLKTEEFGEGTLIPQIQGQSMEQELFLLREELSQAQRKLHEMEEAKASEYQGASEKMERTAVIPKPHDSQEVGTQTKRDDDDDDFKMQLENLQNERDQLRETLQETISKNSEMQEELRCTRESLGQHQETIVELEGNISEKENQLSKVQEALKEKTDELQQKLTEVTENLTRVSAEYGNLLAEKEQTERAMNEQVCQQLERIALLNKEKDELQQTVETCKEREEHLLKLQRQAEILKDSLTSKISEMTEEMKIITSERDQLAEEKSEINTCRESDQLQVQKEQIIFLTQENRSLQEKLDSLLLKTEELGEGNLIPQIQGQSMEQELFLLREELSQAQRKLHEMEEAKASEYQGASEKMERTAVIPKPHDSQEVGTQTKRDDDDDDFKMQLENLQNERDQLRETLQETISKNSEMQEELRCTRESLGQHQETIVELEGNISEKENQLSKVQEALKEKTDELQQKLTEVTENLTRVSAEYGNLLAEKEQTERAMNEQVCQQLERIALLNKEKDELQQTVETCKEREEHLLKLQRQAEILKDSLTSKISEMTEEMKIITSERDQLAEEKSEINTCRESDQLQVQKEQIIFLTQENRSLQEKLDSLLLKTEELGEGTLIPQIQGQSMEQELFLLREELSQAQRKLHEMEEAKASEYQGASKKMERTAVIPKPHDSQEVGTQTKRDDDDDDFKMQLENLQNERDQLRETLQETISKNSEMQEELRCTRESLGQHQETIVELEGNISEKENQLSKVQEALKEKTDELQQKLTEVTENLTRVSAEYGNLLAEKEQTERAMNEQVCQQLERIALLNKEKDELQQTVETCKEREEHLLKLQRQAEILKDSLTSKIQQLTETLNSVSCEKDQLLSEKTSHSLQFKEHISSVNREKDELQKLLQDVRSERDQLKTELQKKTTMCVETKAKLEDALEQLKHKNLNNMPIHVNPVDIAEQVADDTFKEKTLKIKELLEKFPTMGKRYECLSTVSLKLKSELNRQKALIAVILPQLTLEQRKQVKTLQTKNEEMNTRVQKLLTKLKLLFSSVCNKKRDYHTAIHKYEMELLEEKRKQDHLQSQIQCLRKINLKQNEVSSQELNSSEGLQSFHLDAESILKDVSETEHELVCIEAELQQEESARKETVQFWEACSGTHLDAEELKEELEKDNERLLQVFKFWTPKVKILLELSSELDARTANYSKNADVELKQRKEKNQELLQDLNTLKEKLAPGGSTSLALEEENYRLHNKLKAAEQDKKAMEVKIQKLENVINEVGESVKEKDDRISKLQAQIRIRTETSELTQLHAKLSEMDNCLRTALTEKRSLQAKLDKGAELYKEEIDHLKTQLVKCDLERRKESNSFEMKLANYKAVAEHQEQKLTKLKEELRRAHQEQDVTVLKEADPQQSQIPLTCGGGSGIVQSTQMLVIKSEQAKLQKENLKLKKQNDHLVSREGQLKEELRKWKEETLKWREQSSRETIRETIPRSPKKAVSYFFKDQMPSPSKETASQEIVTQDLPKPLPLTCPTNFFDNSNLGMLTDTRPEGTEPTEERLKHLFGTSDKDKAPDCSTQ